MSTNSRFFEETSRKKRYSLDRIESRPPPSNSSIERKRKEEEEKGKKKIVKYGENHPLSENHFGYREKAFSRACCNHVDRGSGKGAESRRA